MYPSKFDALAYPQVYLLSHVPEAEVQRAVLQLLQAERIPSLAVDAGGKQVRGQAFRALKAAGVKHAGAFVKGGPGASTAGLPDIIGTLPGGRALYLEVKAPAWMRLDRKNQMRVVRNAGEPSHEQLAFMDTMAEAGALVGVVWSLGDAAELIEGARIGG